MIAPVIDRIRKLLSAPESAPTRRDDLQIAVAVLLIEAARMDDTFDPHERGTIEALLEHKFQLSHDETQQLLKLAEETAERSHQIHPFTRLAVERMEPAQWPGPPNSEPRPGYGRDSFHSYDELHPELFLGPEPNKGWGID